MVEAKPPPPAILAAASASRLGAAATAAAAAAPRILFSFPAAGPRVTSEYDSNGSVFLQKVLCKLLDGLAKVKLSFRNDRKGEVAEPRLAFVSKHLSLHYDVEKAKEPGIVLSVVEEEPDLQ
ncbi:outer envelope pore protein 37, chloroplastic-like [Eucalyptus grandis]|uniref:outer envelope pore protein 37, chloroplastic-like n=1 Tax=Eucalyptus grandis TaxID=71139 RepID=UPI00192F0814|nr:outer envelope pore protein 37, chloroplastic-like [Eucalyptus grandis]